MWENGHRLLGDSQCRKLGLFAATAIGMWGYTTVRITVIYLFIYSHTFTKSMELQRGLGVVCSLARIFDYPIDAALALQHAFDMHSVDWHPCWWPWPGIYYSKFESPSQSRVVTLSGCLSRWPGFSSAVVAGESLCRIRGIASPVVREGWMRVGKARVTIVHVLQMQWPTNIAQTAILVCDLEKSVRMCFPFSICKIIANIPCAHILKINRYSKSQTLKH